MFTQAIIWINDGLVSWRIYASRGLNELNIVQGYFIQLFWTIIYTCWLYHVCWIVYYDKVSNIRRTLVGNKIVDHSDVFGASPVGAAPTSFSTWHSGLGIWLQGILQRHPQDSTRIF